MLGLLLAFILRPEPLLAHAEPEQPHHHNLLVLNSYHPGYKWSDAIMAGIRSVFPDAMKYEIFIEYMDSKRREDPKNLELFKQLCAHHFERMKPDIVICSDDNAFDFLMINRQELFPGIPIVFCGINNFTDNRLAGQTNITGVAEDFDFKGTLELALQLCPKTRHAVLIGDGTRTSQTSLERISRLTSAYEKQLSFEYYDQLEVGELTWRLHTLPDHSVAFLISYFRDPFGQTYSLEQSAGLIAKASRVPVFSCWDSFIQNGLLGGRVVSAFNQGRSAGELALRVLNGESADRLPIVRESPNIHLVDHAVLKRFKLREQDLPPGSILLNKTTSLYEKYFFWIWGLILIMAFETVLIVILLLSRRRRKRSERALHQQQALLRNIISTIPSSVSWKDTHLVYQGCNEAFIRTTGVEAPHIVVGKDDYELFGDKQEVEEYRDFDLNVLQTGRSVFDIEEQVTRRDGSCRNLLASKVPLFDETGAISGVLGVLTDITELKKNEIALRESEERFRTLAENIPNVAVQGCDRKRRILFWNKTSELLYGYSRQEALGQRLEDLIAPEALRDRLVDAIEQSLRTGRQLPPEELELRSKSNQPVYVHSTQIVIHNSRNEPEFYRSDVDLSERRRMEAKIQQTQKLESLGVLAGGIAHDFNNLLMGILGNADLAKESITPSSPVYEHLADIKTAAKRAADLCRQLLAYSGKGKFIVETINLNDMTQEMTHLLEISISKSVVLKRRFAPNLPAIKADPTQLRQIVMNLITNASEAIGDKSGVISIATSAVECSAEDLRQTWLNEPLPEGRYVCLEVSDTGCGMNEETMKRIFDPFFTSKFTGRGLGLAAVLGIVRGHQGALKVQSHPGQGSTFRLFFPAVAGAAEYRPAEPVSTDTWQGQGYFLLVDDEETVRAVGKRMLSWLGFEVLTAENGIEALELFRQYSDRIAGVLLDLTMPHMNGEDTLQELKKIRPDVRVILSSGYAEQEISRRFDGKGIAGFIQKPYQVESLKRTLQKVLE
ncbi:MAG: hypothetical protein A2X46_09585 [Lentisphaerae bacterium GWF2_57_35]|nr:MAG: hypothetical protein A2X46_09585 [Lentisphaerae bacterium GWF2_57_35]